MRFKRYLFSLIGVIPIAGITESIQLNSLVKDVYQVDPTSIEIDGYPYVTCRYKSTVKQLQWNAKVLPETADQSVIWSLTSDAPDGMFTIDQEGWIWSFDLGYPQHLDKQFWTLNITCTSSVNQSISATKTLMVFVEGYYPTFGELIITNDSGQVIENNTIDLIYGTTSSFHIDCILTNEEDLSDHIKKWLYAKNLPENVNIEGQTLTISNPSIGSQNLELSFLAMDEWSMLSGAATKDFLLTLNTSYAMPVFSDITLQGTGVVDNTNINLSLKNQPTTINASCNITNPNNIDPSLSKSWEIQNQPSGITINSNTGAMSIPNNLAVGNYTFTLTYQCGTYNKQSTINLNIAYDTPQLDNITLTGDGVSDNNINLTYNQSANISASCSITNEANIDPSLTKTWSLNNAPTGVSINTNGQLTIPTTQTLNNTSFSIIYQVGTARQTLSVTLTINYANPVLGEISLTKTLGDATLTGNTINQVYGTTSTFNVTCNINNNVNIDPSLPKIWSVNNAPRGVSIDGTSGLMTINNPSYGNNQAINVTYTVGTITKIQNYTLSVAYATPIFSDLTLQGTGVVDNSHINLLANQSSMVTADCEITNQPNIDPNFTKTWSLKNQPSGVSINSTTGVITIPDTLAINSYNLTIVCRYGSSTKEIIVNLSIGYEMPILSNITLSSANNVIIQGSNVSIDYHTSGSFQATCNITNENNINPSIIKQWSLENNSSAITINNDGIVNITNDAPKMTNQSIIINCNVGGINQTLTFYLTISEKPNDAHKDNTYIIIWSSVAAAILLCVIVSMSIIIRKKISKKS